MRGCLVVERGPIVHCLESVDLAAATDGAVTDIADVRLDPMTPLRIVDGSVVARFRPQHPATALWPYGAEPVEPKETAVDVALVPYHDWAERGPSTMRVWLPAA